MGVVGDVQNKDENESCTWPILDICVLTHGEVALHYKLFSA
jgi:hypothetical protein